MNYAGSQRTGTVRQSNRNTGRTSRNPRNSYRNLDNQYYVDGTAVRKLQPKPARRDQRSSELRHGHTQPGQSQYRRAKRQVRIAPMNKGYVLVMAAAILIVCGVLMSYIKLCSDITNHVNNISKLESDLNDMRLSNDELYTKIISSIDLDEIKRIAVNELGMKYAKEGQIITYTGEGNDYVRQYNSIPTK